MSISLNQAKLDLVALDDAERRLEDELRQVRARRAAIETFLRLYQVYSTNTPPGIPEPGADPYLLEAGTANLAGRIRRTAEALIRTAHSRVGTAAIWSAVAKSGLKITGTTAVSQKNYIAGILSRDANFNAIRRKGWWLESLGPCPSDEADPTLLATAEPPPAGPPLVEHEATPTKPLDDRAPRDRRGRGSA